MSFNNVVFGKRIEGESGLLFELIKEHYKDEIYHYKTPKKQIINIKEKGLFEQGCKVPGILSLFIFITKYKFIDQLFEQILEDNGETPRGLFWQFQEKIDRIKTIKSNPKLIMPNLLEKNNKKLFDFYFNYYQINKEARNSIAHRRIQITICNEWVVEFEDISNSKKYKLQVGIQTIIDFYYQIRAITKDLFDYKIINRAAVMKEIIIQPDSTIEKVNLIRNLGTAYKEEIEHFLYYLVKNKELEIVGTKIRLKT